MSLPAADKSQIRREMIARRAEKSDAWRAEASARIASHAAGIPEFRAARSIALYAAKGAEVGTEHLIRLVIDQVGGALLPRVTSEGQLEFRRVQNFPEAMTKGSFGILEPDPNTNSEIVGVAEMDLIFLPGSAFDRRGARIGYGKGHYDRFLAESHRAKKFGLCFSFQCIDEIPSDPHDVRMDGIITESGIHRVKLT